MSVLHLNLKKKWWDMIASGEKIEEYREIKPYWVTRLSDKHIGAIGGDFMDNHKVISYTFKRFGEIEFKNGYQKDAPTMRVEFAGLKIGKAKPEWSDNWQGNVFIIKLGNIISKSPF